MLALLPVLLVEIAPPGPPARLVDALLQACDQGMREAECVVADHANGRSTLGVAIVSWRDAEYAFVQIDVGRRTPERVRWQTRRIRFQPADSLTERWRTVGFAVATLAEDGSATAIAEPAHAQPRTASTPALAPPSEGASSVGGQTQRSSADSSDRVHHVLAELGFLGGPGLVGQPWRWGIRGRVAVAPWHWPMMAVTSASWSMQPSNEHLSARWLGFSIGAGYSAAPSSELRLDVSGEFAFEELELTAADPSTEATDRATHSSSGALARLSAAWPARGPIATTFGLEGCYRRRSAGIWVNGERVGGWPTLGWSFGLGAEWRVF